MTCDSWHQNRISPVTSSYRVNMGHKKLVWQFAIIALLICSSCGVRRYKYGSRIRSLAERRNYRQPKDYYSVNNIPRSNYKMKNIYEQGKSKYYKYSKRFRWVGQSDKLIIYQYEFLLENLVMIVFMCQNWKQQHQQRHLPLQQQQRPPCPLLPPYPLRCQQATNTAFRITRRDCESYWYLYQDTLQVCERTVNTICSP